MKNLILFSIAGLLSLFTYAQDKETMNEWIDQGILLHDEGKYEQAIDMYDKVLAVDESNIIAYGEKALSQLANKEYDNTIETCKKAISIDPESTSLMYVYTTYANALDESGKPKEAIKIYDQGIKAFPTYYQLHFNKGITLSSLKQYEEALLSFQQAISFQPEHASSHNAIARLSFMQKQNIPSLLAFARFTILEPQGPRQEANLLYIQEIMRANVEKTGKKSVTINLDPATLNDAENNKDKENDFSSTSLLLSLTAALDYDKKNKKKSEVELFASKFQTVCESLKETKEDNSGFYWEYYVPYFIALNEENLTETFAYLVYATSDNKDVKKWLNKNEEKINAFYAWNAKYEW